MASTTTLPPPIQQLAEARLQRIVDAADHAGIDMGDRYALKPALPVLAYSEFVTRICSREPALLLQCLANTAPLPCTYPQLLSDTLSGAHDDHSAKARLRQLRNREMVRIAWVDLSGQCAIDNVLAATSALAEAIIDGTLAHLYTQMCTQWGTPRNAGGQTQQLVVLGMGKLGGGELNFSSDIDLIFAFADNGQCDGGKALDNREFFTRLGQRLITMLNDISADGFVYRVDMRLRPFGDVGPLAVSFDALENYFQTHGREWERYAMVKARVVAGDQQAGSQLLSILKPFIYRRYMDYGAIESLRELKIKIAGEVARKGMQGNIKLGPGGIREIEFIAQVFQLIHGGQNAALQTRSLIDAVEHVSNAGHLQPHQAATLLSAYRFLRRLENRLQMHNDEQIHSLPASAEARVSLALSMGFTGIADFGQALSRHTEAVEQLFQSVFKVDTVQAGTPSELTAVWQNSDTDSTAIATLTRVGFHHPQQAFDSLQTLKRSRFYHNLSTRARTRLDALLPRALGHVVEQDNPDVTLRRLLGLLRAIAGRSVYLAMLLEVPASLVHLIDLLSASAWVAEFVTRHPLVIDELLDPSPPAQCPDYTGLENMARQSLQRLPDNGLGERMDALRRYQQTQMLRIVSADLDGVFTVTEVSEHLSCLAQALLQVASDVTWDELVARYGRPTCRVNGQLRRPGFGIVAYGKLGGMELGYGSDLDIVFLHESEGSQQQTDGAQVVDNAVFFARLAQKLVHFISTLTPAGVLYDVDTRLRPNGASGLLVSRIDAFAEYQLKQAWTWEHQALVRARMVVGSRRLQQRFAAIRQQVLQLPRDRRQLGHDVAAMRKRMFDQLCKGNERLFDIKQDRGGVADIEFMVQYLVLAWVQQYPVLAQYTDNLRLLEFIGTQQIIEREQAEKLAQSYLTLRNGIHRRVLQGEPGVIERADADTALIDGVVEIWQTVMPAVDAPVNSPGKD